MSYYSPEEYELLRLARILGGTSKVKELLQALKNSNIDVGMLLDYLKGIGYKVPSPLETKIEDLERRVSILEGKPPLPPVPPTPLQPPERKGARRAKVGEITPRAEYTLPILETLIEMGGSGRVSDVLNRVLSKMKDTLKPKDFDKVPSGTSIRWKNRAQWVRQRLVSEDYLKRDSPRGMWEITGSGRKLFESLKERR